jgi:predicted nucleic acid-binding protein
MACLWDTDVTSEYLRGKNPHVVRRAVAYLKQYGQTNISVVTRYEGLRGLKAKRATTQLARFEAFSQKQNILLVTDAIAVLTADLWADLKRAGRLIPDNDLLIAATALHHGLTLATGNTAHFSRIPGLTLEDWTKP